jgi:predicted ATPase
MQKIHYLKIQHFKVFGDEVTINFENPTILIGANNSGKTTAIQALALWSWALRIWFEKKKNTKSSAERNKGVALNRLEIAQVPIKEVRYFWNNAKVRQNSNDNIGLTLKVGVAFNHQVQEVGMVFKYHSLDLMYCQPTEESFNVDGLLEFASQLKINLLYPMSGIGDKEYVFQEDAIRSLIGIGQTANVIRNICYNLYTKNKKDWDYLVELMKTLFAITLKAPFLRATGVIEVLYNYSDKSKKTEYDLDITLAGRGQQQTLLVLAYLLANTDSVLMIDEPDAHLEILRQTQIFSVLKEIAAKYGCQIIIVTHSEAVLNEANSVVFLADGQAQEISDRQEHKFIKNALKNYGIEHYYKAKLNPRILYIEGSTDKDMLSAFAKKFNHPSKSFFEDRLNFHYTQNENPQTDIINELQRKAGSYTSHKNHFQAIKKAVPNLKGIAIFDGDNRNRQDEVSDDFGVFYWKRYELENYFITPKTVMAYIEKESEKSVIKGLFTHNNIVTQSIQTQLLLPVLNNDKTALQDFLQLPESLQNVQFQNLASTKKLSELLENVFQQLAKEEKTPILLSKSNFYRLIDFVEIMPQEIKEKLDLMLQYLTPAEV